MCEWESISETNSANISLSLTTAHFTVKRSEGIQCLFYAVYKILFEWSYIPKKKNKTKQETKTKQIFSIWSKLDEQKKETTLTIQNTACDVFIFIVIILGIIILLTVLLRLLLIIKIMTVTMIIISIIKIMMVMMTMISIKIL